MTIASVIPDITNPFYPEFERGIQDIADQLNYDLVVYNTDGILAKEKKALPDFAWPLYVLGTHDGPRLASRIGQAQVRVAAMLLLTLRGTPILYYGDELGLENGDLQCREPLDIADRRDGHFNRDLTRTPMQWGNGLNADFTAAAEPWLPVSQDYRNRNIVSQSNTADSILNLYRRLLWYRKSSRCLALGTCQILESSDGVFTFVRTYQSRQILVALNTTDSYRQVRLPRTGTLVISTYLDSRTSEVSEVALRPNEGILIELP